MPFSIETSKVLYIPIFSKNRQYCYVAFLSRFILRKILYIKAEPVAENTISEQPVKRIFPKKESSSRHDMGKSKDKHRMIM
jgi:hypothetical protein